MQFLDSSHTVPRQFRFTESTVP
uniref:Uncharacterized protein n=1 Tax=Moniliophthora roreri TaxID=221103 RepID=A0A0W0GEK7_MONRR